MIGRIALAACALVVLATTGAIAQQVVTGTVVRIDQPANVIVLDNGHMYQATPQTVFLVNNQPTSFARIAPGTPVVVQYGQPVLYQDGRYVMVTRPAGTVAAPDPAAGAFEVSGVVKYADASRGIVRFEDGRNVAIDENTQVLANGAPVILSTLTPGTFVVVRSSKPLAFRNNTHYVATSPPTVMSSAPVTAVQPVSGTVVRVDQPNTIVLSDGRVIPASSQTVVMVDNRAVPITALRPGAHVVIYPNGDAVVTEPSASPGLVAPEAGLREKEMERNAP
jgi:hypothetical protein